MAAKVFNIMLACAGIHLMVGAAAAAELEASLTIQAQFATELEAVMHASNLYNPASVRDDREYMGAVFSQTRGDKVVYGYTVGAGHAGHDSVSVKIRIPLGCKVVAFWHTHGAGHFTRQYFSPTDTQLAEQWQVPFYMAAADGKLRVFRPGEQTLSYRQARLLGLGPVRGSSAGELIGRGNA